MKRILYVDFENVSSAGLTGMSDLTTDDEVKIFLGPKCSKMSLIEADNIFHGDATVELIKNDQIAKNALDFIIMVHLGYDVAKKAGDLFFIISNDKGYDPAIHEMQVMTGETIARYQDIAQVIKRNDVKPGLLARLFGRKKVETTDDTANATEHEVLKKGHRSRTNGTSGSYGNRSNGARDGYRNGGRTEGNRGNGNRNGYNNGNNGSNRNGSANNSSGNNRNAGSNNRNNASNSQNKNSNVNNAQNSNSRSASAQSEQKTVVRATVLKDEPTKPIVIQQMTAPKPQPVMSHEDDYLDGMSIAELRAQLKDDGKSSARNDKNNNSTNVERKPDTQKKGNVPAKNPDAVTSVKKDADSGRSSSGHRSHGRMKTVLSDSEKALVDRAVAETDNLGDFHNYILKELHDNDRATEIYKSEKHRVKIVSPEKVGNEKPEVIETTASQTE